MFGLSACFLEALHIVHCLLAAADLVVAKLAHEYLFVDGCCTLVEGIRKLDRIAHLGTVYILNWKYETR